VSLPPALSSAVSIPPPAVSSAVSGTSAGSGATAVSGVSTSAQSVSSAQASPPVAQQTSAANGGVIIQLADIATGGGTGWTLKGNTTIPQGATLTIPINTMLRAAFDDPATPAYDPIYYTLTINGALINNGYLELGNINNNGIITNNGSTDRANARSGIITMRYSKGTLINSASGVINNYNGGRISGPITNTGAINNSDGTTIIQLADIATYDSVQSAWVLNAYNPNIGGIETPRGGVLTIPAGTRLTNSPQKYTIFENYGTIIINGVLSIGSNISYYNKGIIKNTGTHLIQSGGAFINDVDGVIYNYNGGKLSVEQGAVSFANGGIINSPRVDTGCGVGIIQFATTLGHVCDPFANPTCNGETLAFTFSQNVPGGVVGSAGTTCPTGSAATGVSGSGVSGS
jgi:hypothetical protein